MERAAERAGFRARGDDGGVVPAGLRRADEIALVARPFERLRQAELRDERGGLRCAGHDGAARRRADGSTGTSAPSRPPRPRCSSAAMTPPRRRRCRHDDGRGRTAVGLPQRLVLDARVTQPEITARLAPGYAGRREYEGDRQRCPPARANEIGRSQPTIGPSRVCGRVRPARVRGDSSHERFNVERRHAGRHAAAARDDDAALALD